MGSDSNIFNPLPVSADILSSSGQADQFRDKVHLPGYDRSKLKSGIVHIGVGGFHRAHQAKYIDSILESGEENNWGICGVGIMPQDELLSRSLHAQNCLYSLTERSGTEDTCYIIGSLIDHISGRNKPNDVYKKIADVDTKIVSLTVTEGGYCRDEMTGELDFMHPGVKNDLDSSVDPQTVYGFLIRGLQLRKELNNGSLTVLCCDNIQHNGDVVKNAVLLFAKHYSSDLMKWIESNVSFPNSMVDRITPVSGKSEQDFVKDRFGLIDLCPVVSEAFTQWVIEDDFKAGRPSLEKVGVQFVSDVAPYERMKLRLLNATHSAMGYPGCLLGYKYIHEVAQSDEFLNYLHVFMDIEMTPLVGKVPGVDLDWYKSSLMERFSNPDICDTVLRICSGGSAKIPGFILPAIQEAIEKEKPIRAMTFTVACWLRYLSGKDENNQEIPLEDPQAERLKSIAKQARDSAQEYLNMQDIFGHLSSNKRFRDELQFWLNSLYKHGTKATLAEL